MTPRSKTKKAPKKAVKAKGKQEVTNKVSLFDDKGNKQGTFELDNKVFNGTFSPYVLYQAVNMYHANQRQGTADTLVRSEVDGGGKKPWKQKGTGRARVGSTRNPLWRKGGIVFGPHPKDFKYDLPKKIKKLALLHSLNSKLADSQFSVITDINVPDHKTKNFQAIIDKTKLEGKILIAVDKKEEKTVLASRNIPGVTLSLFSDVNAFQVLKHRQFLITEKGLELLTKKLKG